jgi:hypothetical protein
LLTLPHSHLQCSPFLRSPELYSMLCTSSGDLWQGWRCSSLLVAPQLCAPFPVTSVGCFWIPVNFIWWVPVPYFMLSACDCAGPSGVLPGAMEVTLGGDGWWTHIEGSFVSVHNGVVLLVLTWSQQLSSADCYWVHLLFMQTYTNPLWVFTFFKECKCNKVSLILIKSLMISNLFLLMKKDLLFTEM